LARRATGGGAGGGGGGGGVGGGTGGAFGASWGSPDPSPARSCRLLGVAFREGTWPNACLSHLDPRPDSRPDEPARVRLGGLPGAWGHLPGRGEKTNWGRGGRVGGDGGDSRGTKFGPLLTWPI
jgi:hypothetical protein